MKKSSIIILFLGIALIFNLLIAFSVNNIPPEDGVEMLFDKEGYYKQIDSLKNEVKDLEKKAEILNRYLNMKHIEFMEVVELESRSSWKKRY